MGYNVPAGAKQPPEQSPTLRAYVRCLGPGDEHMFWSNDRCNNRICVKCMRKIEAMAQERVCLIVLHRGGAKVED